MKRILGLLLLTLAASFLLSGCWNRRELNELGIAVAAGVDKVGDKYRLSVQIAIPGQVASKKVGSPQAPATLFTSEGDTLFEAARRMSQSSPRKIYFAHLRMFIIGESLARQGIAEVLDLLFRDHEFRTDFYFAVSKENTAEETLKIMTPIETIPANKLFTSLQTSEKIWSPTKAVTLDELINDLSSKGKHPVLTGLEIRGDKNIGEKKINVENIYTPSHLVYSGFAVFKSDRLIGWLNEKESRGYRLILGDVKSSVNHVKCRDQGKVVLETLRTSAKVKGSMVKSRPHINIRFSAEGNVGSVECSGLDLTKPETIQKLETEMEQMTVRLIETVIQKVQTEYKVDIFGFGEAIRRSNPKAWKSMKEDWDERYFPNLPVHIQVDYHIRRTGTISDSFLNEIRETR
ncbi:spore germination protein KC [Fontibacillus phaseoli]|uniref:Spore germination protein KC n=1 Tax=Fontibacillus phaseoli TaxID=1416533 RepID=A0A369AV73_9BACL|nr:Ger(x)C family spore germination protein [Fontibacillus phaseoli]RCX13282.1 spore germination protein KC [Fontibacillus phaseoli]